MKIKIYKNKNIKNYKEWPIWTCEPSNFPWTYDAEEHCYIIKGNVKVITPNETVTINEGDYVVFPKSLKCTWEVIQPIKKYYTFK